MTTEGSFPLGGAVCVTAITQGVSPIVATLLGVGAGMCAGLVTGLFIYEEQDPSNSSWNPCDVGTKFSDAVCDALAKSFSIESTKIQDFFNKA